MDDPRSESRDDAHDVARSSDADLTELSRQMRILARHIARDESAADDLVQDAWLAALESKSVPAAGLTGWLRGVIRNVSRRKARRARARDDAELMAASEEASASELELVERISTYRALRDSVDRLREPSRTVLRMRYFDDRSPAEIALELGRPLETVRTQLQRGLIELRESVARRRAPDRDSWALALLGRLPGWSSRSSHVARWTTMLAAVLVIAVVVWFFARTNAVPVQLAALAPPVPQPAAVVELQPATDPVRERPTAEPGDEPAEITSTRRDLALRVVDPAGDAVSGATVVLSGASQTEVGRATTGADGRAVVDVTLLADVAPPFVPEETRGIIVEAFATGWSTSPLVIVPCGIGATDLELALGGPAQRIVGRARGPDGGAVAGVVISLEPHVPGLRAGADGRPYMESPALAVADAEGNFVLDHLPRREHRYVVQAPGVVALRGVLAGDDDVLELDVTLARGVELRGRVVRADGAPAPGARVWSTDHNGDISTAVQTTADESGAFALGGLSPGPQYVFACDAADPAWSAGEEIELGQQASAAWTPTLRPGEPLIVRVESATGAVIGEAIVLLRLPAAERAKWRTMGTTGPSGRLVIQHRPPVALECVVMRPGTSREPIVRLLEAGAQGEIVVRLPDDSPPEFVRARFVSSEPDGLVGARVVALGVDVRFQREVAIAGGTGEAVDLGLPVGTHRLHVVGPRGAFDAGVVQVVAGSESVLAPITIPRAVEVGFDWSSAPVGDAWTLQGLGDSGGEEIGLPLGTLASGVATRALWPGRYVLSALRPDGTRVNVRFEVSSREQARVAVR